MTDPMPNLVEEPSALEQSKLLREQRRERRRLRAIEDEGLARATAQSDEDRTLAKQVAMNRFSPSGRRVMSPAQATSKALRDMQAGSSAATPSGGASGFQSTGMDGKPGFQLRTEEERKARIAASPLPTASSTPLSSVPDRPRTAMAPAPVAPAPAPTVTGMQAMAADAQSFRMTNQGMQGPPAALAAPKPMAPGQSAPAPPVAVPPVTATPAVASPPSASPMPVMPRSIPGGTSGKPTYTNLPADPFTSPYSSAKVAGTTPAEAAKNFGSANPPAKVDLGPGALLRPMGEAIKTGAKSLATGFARMTNPSAPPSMPKPARSLSSLGAAPDDQTKKVRTPSGVSAARG